MKSWKSYLTKDPTEWLLEKNNPSVRYFTLHELLEKPWADLEVKKTKQTIMNSGVVPKILSKQKKEGYWETPERFYTAKYKGTIWQLMILAEYGADQNNDKIRKACEFILASSQDKQNGGFAYSSSTRIGGGRHSEVIPCLTGNMVWSLLRFGYFEDPRLQQGIK